MCHRGIAARQTQESVSRERCLAGLENDGKLEALRERAPQPEKEKQALEGRLAVFLTLLKP
jgi:hypothetical protein